MISVKHNTADYRVRNTGGKRWWLFTELIIICSVVFSATAFALSTPPPPPPDSTAFALPPSPFPRPHSIYIYTHQEMTMENDYEKIFYYEIRSESDLNWQELINGERDRDRETEGQRETERDRERENTVCL